MKVKSILFGSIILLICISNGFGQEAMGLKTGGYNGINSTRLNPAFAFKSKNKWDIQLAGAHAFFQTDYGHIHNSNLFKTLSNLDSITELNYPVDDIVMAEDLDVVYKIGASASHVDVHAEFLGPGFLFNVNPDLKVGMSYALRAYGSMHDIPSIFNYYSINNTFIDSTYTSEKINSVAARWHEVSFHVSKKIDKIVFGAQVKYLLGWGMGHFSVDNNFSFNSPTEASVTAASTGQFNVASIGWNESDRMQGTGIGIDIGINIDDFLMEGSQLGVSILDIGSISSAGQNITYGFDLQDSLVRDNYLDIRDDITLINQLNNDFEVIEDSGSLTAGLPLALSIQYKYQINEKFSFESALTQRIKLSKTMLSRPNSFYVGGVYENKYFSAYLPVTVYDYKSIRPGLALRALFFTIGSDDLLSLFGKNDFNGTDLYVNLSFYPFWNGKDKTKNLKEGCDYGF